MAISREELEVSWTGAVERFVETSEWLNDSHLPQLKALYAIAKILDGGERPTPALVSQFTLTQRTLAGKAPGGLGGDGDELPPSLLDELLDSELG